MLQLAPRLKFSVLDDCVEQDGKRVPFTDICSLSFINLNFNGGIWMHMFAHGASVFSAEEMRNPREASPKAPKNPLWSVSLPLFAWPWNKRKYQQQILNAYRSIAGVTFERRLLFRLQHLHDYGVTHFESISIFLDGTIHSREEAETTNLIEAVNRGVVCRGYTQRKRHLRINDSNTYWISDTGTTKQHTSNIFPIFDSETRVVKWGNSVDGDLRESVMNYILKYNGCPSLVLD